MAVKWRDVGVKRKAIRLLRASRRQEGVLNSLLTAGGAERILEIEEMGLSGREVLKAGDIKRDEDSGGGGWVGGWRNEGVDEVL